MFAEQSRDLDEPYRRIDVDEARMMIERDDVQVVDVRRPGEYAAVHLPGSLLIPLDKLFARSGELRPEKEIIFVCTIGVISELAAEIAASVGCHRVCNMAGGIAAWLERGYPTEP